MDQPSRLQLQNLRDDYALLGRSLFSDDPPFKAASRSCASTTPRSLRARYTASTVLFRCTVIPLSRGTRSRSARVIRSADDVCTSSCVLVAKLRWGNVAASARVKGDRCDLERQICHCAAATHPDGFPGWHGARNKGLQIRLLPEGPPTFEPLTTAVVMAPVPPWSPDRRIF
jgi:hypothetical protein